MTTIPPDTATPPYVRGLTLRQPWAAAIAAHPDPSRAKTIENRSWPPSVPAGTTLLIHAGATIERGVLRDPYWGPMVSGLDLTTKAVVAVARLAGHHPADGRCTPWSMPETAWHWELDHVHPLPLPVPAKGALGLWAPDAGLLSAVRTQLGTTAAAALLGEEPSC